MLICILLTILWVDYFKHQHTVLTLNRLTSSWINLVLFSDVGSCCSHRLLLRHLWLNLELILLSRNLLLHLIVLVTHQLLLLHLWICHLILVCAHHLLLLLLLDCCRCWRWFFLYSGCESLVLILVVSVDHIKWSLFPADFGSSFLYPFFVIILKNFEINTGGCLTRVIFVPKHSGFIFFNLKTKLFREILQLWKSKLLNIWSVHHFLEQCSDVSNIFHLTVYLGATENHEYDLLHGQIGA